MWPTLTRYKCATNNNRFYFRWLYSLSSECRGNYLNHKSSKFSDINKTLPKFQTIPATYLSLSHLAFWYPKLNSLFNSVIALNWKPSVFNFLNTKSDIIKNNIPHKIIPKLHLNDIVTLGFYSGLIIQRIHVGSASLSHWNTSYCRTTVNQLLDYLHSLYIPSHNIESLKLQDLKNEHTRTPIPESFIEFEIPKIDIAYANEWESNITNENLLIHLRSVIESIDQLHSNVKKIFRNCGYLPIENFQCKNRNNQLRIYFPNKTVRATKTLVTDLGIKEGTVYECPNADIVSFRVKQNQRFYHINNKINDNSGSYDNDILSSSCNGSFDSIDSDLVLLSSLSPILSQQSL